MRIIGSYNEPNKRFIRLTQLHSPMNHPQCSGSDPFTHAHWRDRDGRSARYQANANGE